MENLEAIYRGQRLADIYPSFFESTSDTTEGASSESLTGGQGGKKKRGPFKIKIPVSGKRKGKRGSQRGSREALLTPHGDESDADAENSTTEASSSGSLAGGQGGKKKRGPFKIKIPVSGKRKGKRGSHGGSREALLTPHGDESDADAENSTTEGSSSEPLAEGEDRKKKKGLRRLKSAFAGKKRRNGSPPSSSQENLVAPGGDEGEAEAETPRPASLGVVFDANRLAQTTDIGKEVLGSFTTNANQQKEIFEAIEATTADGDSCLKFVVDLDTERVGYFPHELQSVRQGLLIYTACERILENLKQFNGISSSPTPGNSVKVLDDFLHPSEPVFTVQTVEGQTASLEGVEKTVNVLKLILAPNAVEVAFVDTALNGSWHTLENEDPEIFARLLDFATQSGYGETLETGRKTGNFGGLLLSLKEKSSGYSPAAHTFSHLMSSVCSTGDAKKSQAALRMAAFYSFDEVVELDQIVAGAWLVAKQLLVSSRDLTKSVSVGIPPSVEDQAGPSSHSEPKQQQAESGMSRPSPGSAHALSSSEAEGASLLEDSRKLSPPTAHHPVAAEEAHPFVVGGNANINAMNISATANVCRLLLETDMTNPLLFASTVLTNIRGYINDSGAGLESTEKQRKLAKRSDVFATIYKCFSCGLGGELLPPLFAPFASIALQIGTFLRVELEESKALPWEKIVQTMGDGVFSTNAYESAVKHLKKKAASFLEMFTPCVTEVEEASELLMPSESAKNKRTLLRSLKNAVKRTKGKRRGATGEMCATSGELQQLVRLLLVWWVLGPSSSEQTQEMTESFQSTATTFRNARLAFTSLIFNNGHNQAKVAMELVKAGCKTNKFVVPPGWTLGSKKGRHGARELSFKDISKDIMASFMYTESTLGSHGVADWILPLNAAQQLVDICAQHPVVQLGELLSTDAGNVILMGHQCIKLQGYQEPAHLPGKAAAKAMEFHCPGTPQAAVQPYLTCDLVSAHAPLRMQNLAEVPLPDSTQFCTAFRFRYASLRK
ncbi:LOW QUALITY PROTEIN: uncharacterized protein EMH_0047470 [Eimeria mitis]|uniref:Uncharacterized protein n=1 Tax=Eimeria mitis TaxID=44415 RepID=U6KB35_9EIME|nr:LOW QUALITY PROTEIN: uncharacterized protein EMH_0047470 [Eimeria mitis]CDJ32698.1 hypothetical protein EMH_0047470 [Eimeria mitis]